VAGGDLPRRDSAPKSFPQGLRSLFPKAQMRASLPISEHDGPASLRFFSFPKNGAKKEGVAIDTPLT
jgi:hypothetical protein